MSNPCGTAISLAAARTIVVRAPAHARSSDFPPLTVAVLDAAGRLVAVAGEDVSSLLRERIARASAAGALNVGVGSGSLATRAEAAPRSSTPRSPWPPASWCLSPAGCLSATTTTTSSERSGSAGSWPTATKPAGSAASPRRGGGPTPEPDPTLPTNE